VIGDYFFEKQKTTHSTTIKQFFNQTIIIMNNF